MIKYFCQFSYGGYKVFRIYGTPHEELKRVVAGTSEDNIPIAADRYFNYGGAKLVYRYLDNNMLMLAVSEIPGPVKDGNGRTVNCAIQFVGESNDRETLDKLTITIANNMTKFETEFASMFDFRGGLFFDGDRLDTFVKQCGDKVSFENYAEKLLSIRQQQGEVLLLVPFSDNFGEERDKKVTEKLLSELQLPDEAAKESRIIRWNELKNMQAEKKTDVEINNIESLNKKLFDLQSENTSLRKARDLKSKECVSIRDNYIKKEKVLSILTIIFCVLSLILLFTDCFVAAKILIGVVLLIASIKTYKLFKP